MGFREYQRSVSRVGSGVSRCSSGWKKAGRNEVALKRSLEDGYLPIRGQEVRGLK